MSMCDQYNADLGRFSGLTAEVKVFGIVLVEHGGGYVGHVPTRVTFAS